MRLPPWIRDETRRHRARENGHGVRVYLRSLALHTVCEEARCPNQKRCFERRTATFMILGDRCTRSCGFCAVRSGTPDPPDPGEPGRVAAAVQGLGLRYVVITSVSRDDLVDGGASQFWTTIRTLKTAMPGILVEVLTPDFRGDPQSLGLVFDASPDVFNHNVETVPRLYPQVRPQASYRRSLDVLAAAAGRGNFRVKSGIMIGLGETEVEVLAVLRDVRAAGCTVLTIGQYLQPRKTKLPVRQYVEPEQFERYAQAAREIGFSAVASAPLVRSSMDAEELNNV